MAMTIEAAQTDVQRKATNLAGRGTVRAAVAGQPNVGKSTVFNLLTGLNQHVGNWPGKTVEQKTGVCQHAGARFELVDLPGTYSLTANSLEEVIARDYIIRERPDVVIVILDAATLERSLYLVAEILTLPSKVVVGLNMIDVARQEGVQIEPHVLQAALGVPVIPMVATKNQGVQEILETALGLVEGNIPYVPRRPEIRADHQHVLSQIETLTREYTPSGFPPEWVALKLLEGDRELLRVVQETMPASGWDQVQAILV